MKIEMGRVYKTRDGREVRIYAVDGEESYPVHGAVKSPANGSWSISYWTSNGRACNSAIESRLDLIEVKPRWEVEMSDIVERLRLHGDKFPIKDSAEWIDFASLYLVEAADEIERLQAALEAASPWKQMDSAPKDGTPVLVVFLYDDGEVLHRVVWWDNVRTWPWRDEFTGYREQNAVAWMPLPEPPELGGGDE